MEILSNILYLLSFISIGLVKINLMLNIYQFPESVIELPPVPLWSSTIMMGGHMKINESGTAFVDNKVNYTWTLYVRDFSVKEFLQEKNRITVNTPRLTDDDFNKISKKSVMKLIKTEIFFEDEMSRIQNDNECHADINQMILSISCRRKDGVFSHDKYKFDCAGKKDDTYICTSETIESTNSNLIGNTIRVDIDIKDEFFKQTAFPIYRGGTLMPYKIESTYALAR